MITFAIITIALFLGTLALRFLFSIEVATYKLLTIPASLLCLVGFFRPATELSANATTGYYSLLLAVSASIVISFILRAGNYLFTSRGKF